MFDQNDSSNFLICCSGCRRVKAGNKRWVSLSPEDLLATARRTVSHKFCDKCVHELYGYLNLASSPIKKTSSIKR